MSAGPLSRDAAHGRERLTYLGQHVMALATPPLYDDPVAHAMLYPAGHSLSSVAYGTQVPDGAWSVTVPYAVGVGIPNIRL